MKDGKHQYSCILLQVNSILRVISGKLTEKEESGNQHRIPWQSTPVTREVLAFGIRPFLHTTCQKKEVETKVVNAPLNKAHRRPEMGNFVQPQCVEFLSARRDHIVQVESVLPAFSAKENTSPWEKVLREIKVQEGFAIIGLALPPPGK